MATTKSLGTINIFPSTDSFAANKSSVGATDLNFIKQTAAEMSVVGGGIIAQSLGENGYVKFANGLILQWGKINSSGGWYSTFTYPIKFSSAVYSAICIPNCGPMGNYNNNPSISSVTTSSCQCTMYDGFSGGWYIMVIGG